MALDARSLAHAPGRRRLRALLGLAPALGLALAGPAAGAPPSSAALAPDLPPAAYEAASTGAVRGRAYLEAGRPGAPDQPVSAVTVTLVPRSDALLGRLAALKRRLRDDPRRYPTSAEVVAGVRREYEEVLIRAGGGGLVRRAVSAADGTFGLAAVPAGPWLLVAERAVWVERPGPALSRRERQIFEERPRLAGYYAVTIWVREVSVEAGGQTTVELNDRNAWMTAIAEKRTPDAPSR